MSDHTQEEAHTGPIKTPQQLLLTVFFAFVIPVFAIIGLVYFVVSESKPAGSAETESHVLGGVTTQDMQRGVAQRIRKVGMVEIRDANRAFEAAPVLGVLLPNRPGLAIGDSHRTLAGGRRIAERIGVSAPLGRQGAENHQNAFSFIHDLSFLQK